MTTDSQPDATPGRADTREWPPAHAEHLTDTETFLLELLERLDASEVKNDHLQRALEHSRDIGAAIGVLMSQHKVTRDEAFELLSGCSQAQNRKVYDIAQDVLRLGDLPADGR